MWKYIAMLPIAIALIGSIYGGLRIASDLQTTLEQTASGVDDAHERLNALEFNFEGEASKMEMDMENALEKLGFTIDNNKSTVGYQIEDFQRELLQVQKQLTMLEGITQSIEKKSFENASIIQVDGLRELIYQQRDKIMQLENPTDSGMNYQQMIFDLQTQIQEINRRIDEEHRNWN
jgi:hypothetical protein